MLILKIGISKQPHTQKLTRQRLSAGQIKRLVVAREIGMKRITLPAGLRIEVVDDHNLTVPIGTKATICFDDDGANPMCMVDGHDLAACLPIDQCKIITDNFKKNFRPAAK